MLIWNVRHRGLERLLVHEDPRDLRADQVKRINRVVQELLKAPSPDRIRGLPGWRIHQLVGDRAGTWRISVTKNWRITFVLIDGVIHDLNLEDYH